MYTDNCYCFFLCNGNCYCFCLRATFATFFTHCYYFYCHYYCYYHCYCCYYYYCYCSYCHTLTTRDESIGQPLASLK